MARRGDVEMRLSPGPGLDLLVMGKTGHGKSSTANSILGRKHFLSCGGGASVTNISLSSVGHTEIDGRKIKVVDIPGLCDTAAESEQDKTNIVVNSIKKGIKQFPRGFSALLLVLSYTTRMTDEEKNAIQTLKLIFGKDVLRKHTVIIFTHGDSFRNDKGDEADFDSWAMQQDSYKELLEECGLFVLFDNMTRSQEEKKSQLINLVSKIDSLAERQTRYTVDKFKCAQELHLNLEKYSQENGLIKDDFDKIMKGPPEKRLGGLDKLIARITKLKEALSKDDNADFTAMTKELDGILMAIEPIKTMLLKQEQEKLEREKLERQMKEMKLDSEKRIRQEERWRREDERKRLQVLYEMKEFENKLGKGIVENEHRIVTVRDAHPWVNPLIESLGSIIAQGLPAILNYFSKSK